MWWLTDRLHVAERSGDNLCEFKNGDWAKAYHHLTLDERCHIDMMKESGEAAIARRLGRDPSTISCELTRNASRRAPREPTRDADRRDYDFAQADRLAAERRSAASAQPRDPGAVGRSRRAVGPAVESGTRTPAS